MLLECNLVGGPHDGGVVKVAGDRQPFDLIGFPVVTFPPDLWLVAAPPGDGFVAYTRDGPTDRFPCHYGAAKEFGKFVFIGWGKQ